MKYGLNLAQKKLSDDDISTITDVYNFMQVYDQIKIIIEGHADYIGNNAKLKNYPLSIDRAEAVFSVLTNLGIDESRLYKIGFSDLQPKYQGEQEYKNRRVEFVVIRNDEAFATYTNKIVPISFEE